MFLVSKKHETSQTSKVPKKRPSLVNLIQRHFYSPARSSGKDEFGSAPPPPPPQSRSRSRKHPKSHFTTSAPEPRSSRSTASLDSRPPSSLLPPHRSSHRRSHSATPAFIPAVAPAPVSAPAQTSAPALVTAPAPAPAQTLAPTRASSPIEDDFLKTEAQERRESRIAVERKIWPAQHRYSQEKDPHDTSN